MAATSAAAHVVIFPGISGPFPSLTRLERLIQAELPDTTTQILDWTVLEQPRSWLGNLQDIDTNRARAEVISEQLAQWRAVHPHTRLYLVGISGGAGMILFTLDNVPADIRIERVLLLSGAVSRSYDLSRALTKSRGGIVAYRSPVDLAFLHTGTSLFGSFDRKHAPSAGCVGFDSPPQPELAEKLIQVSWTTDDIRLGNLGGHFGSLAPAYFRIKLLPYLEDRKHPAARWPSRQNHETPSAGPVAVTGPRPPRPPG